MPLLDAMSRASDGEESRTWLPILVDARLVVVDLPLPDAVFSGGGDVVDGSLLLGCEETSLVASEIGPGWGSS